MWKLVQETLDKRHLGRWRATQPAHCERRPSSQVWVSRAEETQRSTLSEGKLWLRLNSESACSLCSLPQSLIHTRPASQHTNGTLLVLACFLVVSPQFLWHDRVTAGQPWEFRRSIWNLSKIFIYECPHSEVRTYNGSLHCTIESGVWGGVSIGVYSTSDLNQHMIISICWSFYVHYIYI